MPRFADFRAIELLIRNQSLFPNLSLGRSCLSCPSKYYVWEITLELRAYYGICQVCRLAHIERGSLTPGENFTRRDIHLPSRQGLPAIHNPRTHHLTLFEAAQGYDVQRKHAGGNQQDCRFGACRVADICTIRRILLPWELSVHAELNLHGVWLRRN